MCLKNCKSQVESFLRKHGNKQSLTVYKRVDNTEKGYLRPPYVTSHGNDMNYLPGVTKSDSKMELPCRQEGRHISHGIHVYLNRDIALDRMAWMGETLIKLTVSPKDLLGVNKSGDIAVFKQVHLSNKEYKRAIN